VPFSHIAGNDSVKSELTSLLPSLKGTTLLFSGPPGVGKLKMAKAIGAYLLNDKERVDKENHPDLSLYCVEGKSRIHTAESIQKLIDTLQIPPFEASCRIAIVDAAERMPTTSSNRLLKSLEELEATWVVILITTHPEKLLLTIVSRSRSIRFLPLKEEELNAADPRIAYLAEGSLQKASLLGAPLQLQIWDHLKKLEESRLYHKRLLLIQSIDQILTGVEEENLETEVDLLFDQLLYLHRGSPDLDARADQIEHGRAAYKQHIKLKTILDWYYLLDNTICGK